MIFDTNIRTAHAAGRWKQIQRTKAARPYLRYSAIGDARTRPAHRAWDGTIRHVDDAFWRTHYPPNDWRCRCSVRTLSAREMAREGLRETPADKVPSGNAGIGEGWDYNVGTAAWGNRMSEQAMRRWRASRDKWEVLTAGNWKSEGLPERLPVRVARAAPGPETPDEASMLGAVREAIGGEEAVFTMPDGVPLHVSAEILGKHLFHREPKRGRFAPLLRETIEEPAEIWQSFERHKATGEIALRRHVISALRAGDERRLLLVLNAQKSLMEGWTFYPVRNVKGFNWRRRGALIFAMAREGEPDDR